MTANAKHSSRSAEHYTPVEFVEAAREVLGEIDVDPASCASANTLVRAREFYDLERNGFLRPWHGRVFVNPPGGYCDHDGLRVETGCEKTGSCGLAAPHRHDSERRSAAAAWWFRLADEYMSGRAVAGVCVAFTLELLQTTQRPPVLRLPAAVEFPFCIIRKRIAFLQGTQDHLKPGASPPHASAFIYLPPTWADHELGKFRRVFSRLGHVVIPDTDGAITSARAAITRESAGTLC